MLTVDCLLPSNLERSWKLPEHPPKSILEPLNVTPLPPNFSLSPFSPISLKLPETSFLFYTTLLSLSTLLSDLHSPKPSNHLHCYTLAFGRSTFRFKSAFFISFLLGEEEIYILFNNGGGSCIGEADIFLHLLGSGSDVRGGTFACS